MRKVVKSWFGKVKTIKVDDSQISKEKIYALIDDRDNIYYLHRDSVPPEARKPYSFKCLHNCYSYMWERFETVTKALKFMVKHFEIYEFETQKEFLEWCAKKVL